MTEHDKITESLIPEAQNALRGITSRNGVSEVEAINLALQVFNFIESKQDQGYVLAFVNEKALRIDVVKDVATFHFK